MGNVDWSSFLALADMLPSARRTFVIGAGRSGLVARSFGMRLMHAGLPVFVPGETITPAAGEGDLLVAISCTGQTGFTEYIARRACELGAKVVVITA
ncbi:MAG: SIS domain-containing protein, partial [Planctomycetes bacterium]|nr:SIS domain-containing protein [Planctomycetota bacterium]